MTGKELIMYILENDLENETLIWLMSEEEAAVKFGVGVATIRAWYIRKMLSGIQIRGRLYFLRDVSDPRKDDKRE